MASICCWPAGQFPGQVVALLAQDWKLGVHAVEVVHHLLAAAPGVGPEQQVVVHAQILEHLAPLRHLHDALRHPLVGGHPGQITPLERQPAPGGRLQAGQGHQQGGLARAVGAHQGHDFTPVDAQVDVVQHLDLAIGGGQPLHHQHAFAGARSLDRRARGQAQPAKAFRRAIDDLVAQFAELLPHPLSEQRVVLHVPGLDDVRPVVLAQQLAGTGNHHPFLLPDVLAQRFGETCQGVAERFPRFRPVSHALRQQVPQLLQALVPHPIAPRQLVQQRNRFRRPGAQAFVQLDIGRRAVHAMREMLDVVEDLDEQTLVRTLLVDVHITQQQVQQIQNPPQCLMFLDNDADGLFAAGLGKCHVCILLAHGKGLLAQPPR